MIKVYVRAISDNVESEAKEIKLVCGEPTPSSKQCLQKAPKLANVDLGHNNVEINLAIGLLNRLFLIPLTSQNVSNTLNRLK